MRDLPRNKLCELLSEHGTALLSMQGMFGVLMRQRCPGHDPEVDALIQTLHSGVAGEISQLMDRSAWEEASQRWTDRLAGGSGNDEAARWAVDSWGLALGKHPDTPATRAQPAAFEKPWDQAPIDLVAPPTGSFLRSAVFWQLILVAAAGCAGGVAPAFELWYHPAEHFLGRLPAPASVDQPKEIKPEGLTSIEPEPKAANPPAPLFIRNARERALDPSAAMEEARANLTDVFTKLKERPDFLFFMGFLAAVGAMTGGTIGFMLGSGGSGTLKSALSGSALGTIGLGVFWTFQSAYTGAWVGLLFQDTAVSFFAAGLAALVGGGLGGFIGKYIPVLFYCWLGLLVANLLFGFTSLEALLLQM